MAYSDKVLDHYNNPRNVGSLDKNSAEVGTGLVGAPECGDVMRLQIKVNPETSVIEDAKFKTFGCGSAIASSSLATEWVKGKTVEEALAIKNTDIVKELSLASGEDSLLGAGGRCDPRGDRRLEEEAGQREAEAGRSEQLGRANQLREQSMATRQWLSHAASEARSGQKIMSTTDRKTDRHSSAAPAQGHSGHRKGDRTIRSAMAKENISPEQGGLRVGVQGGGCSGLSYNIRFDSQPRERDRVFQFGDVRVFVDPKSFIYLHGMMLDYEETLMQQGFVFKNPNAQKSCGCGTSFSA